MADRSSAGRPGLLLWLVWRDLVHASILAGSAAFVVPFGLVPAALLVARPSDALALLALGAVGATRSRRTRREGRVRALAALRLAGLTSRQAAAIPLLAATSIGSLVGTLGVAAVLVRPGTGPGALPPGVAVAAAVAIGAACAIPGIVDAVRAARIEPAEALPACPGATGRSGRAHRSRRAARAPGAGPAPRHPPPTRPRHARGSRRSESI